MAALTHVDSSAAQVAPAEEGPLLYDLVFEKLDMSKREPSAGASKVSRDTMNPTHLRRERHMGTFKTTHCMAFTPPLDHAKPDFANKPIIRDTFYRWAVEREVIFGAYMILMKRWVQRRYFFRSNSISFAHDQRRRKTNIFFPGERVAATYSEH